MRWHARGLDQLFLALFFAVRASALDGRGRSVGRRRLGHAHDLVRQIVGFALVAITWRVDQALSLYRCAGRMGRNPAEVVSGARYGTATSFRLGSIGHHSDRGDNRLGCLRFMCEVVHIGAAPDHSGFASGSNTRR
jgi:hypothetical protein